MHGERVKKVKIKKTSWIYLQDCTKMDGQQNIKINTKFIRNTFSDLGDTWRFHLSDLVILRAVSSSFCHSVYLFCGLPYFLVVETRADELNRFFLLRASAIPVCHLTDQSYLKGSDKVVGVETVSSLNYSLILDVCTYGICSGSNRRVTECVCWCGAKRNLVICIRLM